MERLPLCAPIYATVRFTPAPWFIQMVGCIAVAWLPLIVAALLVVWG